MEDFSSWIISTKKHLIVWFCSFSSQDIMLNGEHLYKINIFCCYQKGIVCVFSLKKMDQSCIYELSEKVWNIAHFNEREILLLIN